MEPGLKHTVLTVINYAVDDDEIKIEGKSRVTIQATASPFMIASHDAKLIDGHELYKVNLVFSDNLQMELYVSPLDLTSLEMAIGSYFTPE
jgi:hypothetical protein